MVRGLEILRVVDMASDVPPIWQDMEGGPPAFLGLVSPFSNQIAQMLHGWSDVLWPRMHFNLPECARRCAISSFASHVTRLCSSGLHAFKDTLNCAQSTTIIRTAEGEVRISSDSRVEKTRSLKSIHRVNKDVIFVVEQVLDY